MRTRVGYAGGHTVNPTYHNLGDHMETVQIDYDPEKISYKDLLEVFWRSHDPTRMHFSRQYMSAVFYHNEAQKRLALETREHRKTVTVGEIHTEILPAGDFYPAEAYHQKYVLRRDRLLAREYDEIYPKLENFVDSTAVARVNGFVAGYGTPEGLKSELDSLGLSPEAGRRLLRMVVGAGAGRNPC